MFCCNSHPCGVTGTMLPYIRLLAGLELVLSSTAPAKPPTEPQAHIHHYTDFQHPILFYHFLSAHSFMSSYLAVSFYPIYLCVISFSFFFCVSAYDLISSLSLSLGK